MGLNTSKAQAAAQVAAPAEPQTMTLQLARLTRLVYVGGGIYENTKAYRFQMDDAQRKLAEVDTVTGMPVWRVYRPTVKQEVQSTPQEPVVVDAVEAPTVNTPAPAAAAAPKGIELGSPEEEAELGLPPVDGEVVHIG